jgi:peptide/nickel transport system ATP-binding protein
MDEIPVLQVKDLAITYKTRKGEVNAVRDVSFTIHAGENLGLVGESGCGKSTVAFSIVNFLGRNGRVAGGSILFKGQELAGRPEEELRKLRGADIAMVYQDPMSALNPTMGIGDQLIEALVAHRGLSKQAARGEALAMLQNVHMPEAETVLRRYPHQLSGGQQQRVLIGMAMLNNPTLLIMDEPTTALDVTVEATVLDLVAELKEKYRTATLYISHNLGVVARVSDRVAVMYAGEIVEMAATETIFTQPRHPYTVGLMRCLPDVDAPRGTRHLQPIPGQVPGRGVKVSGCIFAPRCEVAERRCSVEHPRLSEIEPGHWARCTGSFDWTKVPVGLAIPAAPGALAAQAERPAKQPDEILEVRHLKTYYSLPARSLAQFLGQKPRPTVKAVDDVTFSIPYGSTLGIVGESGCGKSTLARTIVGLETPGTGKIEFLGMDITESVDKRGVDVIRQLQMVFQNPDGTLNPSYSVGDQIAASLRRFKSVRKDQVYGEVVRLLRAVKLDESYYRSLPRQLSGGEKQRVGIARAIAGNPSMVLCDEPVSALDVSVQAAVVNLLDEIRHQQNTSMMLISHDLSTVRFFADYVAVMYLGRIVEIGPVECIYTPPSHPYTAALLAAVPRPDPSQKHERLRLSGNVPSPINPPSGCRFHTRCPHMIVGVCDQQEPPDLDLGEGHHIWCHLERAALANVGQ